MSRPAERPATRIRPFLPADAPALASLFHAAVHEIASRHYGPAQIAAWAPAVPDPARFLARGTDGRILLVAEGPDGAQLAYGDVESDGHIDHLFCRPDAAGTGVTVSLYAALEAAAAARGIRRLHTEASEPARRFFEKRGFAVDHRRDFELAGVPMHNYAMHKSLAEVSMEPPSIRRIVTGHDDEGKSVVLSDGPAPRVFTLDGRGSAFVELWSTRATPAPIDRASGEPTEQGIHLFPPPNGTRLRIVDFPPETPDVLAQLTPEVVHAAFSAIDAASAIPDGPKPHPLMHRHETVDYGLVLEGELVLVLDGSETPLRAGDVVIQRGTSHAWANRSGRPARMAFILIDGTYEPELK